MRLEMEIADWVDRRVGTAHLGDRTVHLVAEKLS